MARHRWHPGHGLALPDDAGHVTHGDSLERASAGCVHFGNAGSRAFFDCLQVNDEVQVVP